MTISKCHTLFIFMQGQLLGLTRWLIFLWRYFWATLSCFVFNLFFSFAVFYQFCWVYVCLFVGEGFREWLFITNLCTSWVFVFLLVLILVDLPQFFVYPLRIFCCFLSFGHFGLKKISFDLLFSIYFERKDLIWPSVFQYILSAFRCVIAVCNYTFCGKISSFSFHFSGNPNYNHNFFGFLADQSCEGPANEYYLTLRSMNIPWRFC